MGIIWRKIRKIIIKKLREESAVLYKQNDIADNSLTTMEETRKILEEHILLKKGEFKYF